LKEKKGDKWVAAEKVKAMYVTFDKKANAVESAPSEWNAWNSYKYEGLNTVVEGTTATIKISPNEDQEIINDFIGFRVYAVNLDGTLVDPDGRALIARNDPDDFDIIICFSTKRVFTKLPCHSSKTLLRFNTANNQCLTNVTVVHGQTRG
jgi:hypothetical protein